MKAKWWKWSLPSRFWIPFAVLWGLAISSVLIPVRKSLFEDDYSTVILDENGEILRVFLNKDQQWILPPDSGLEVPNKLKKAVLTFEDKRFYQHPGVDLLAIFRATIQNIKAGEIKSGASTLTMQVARLSNPKSRHIFNKIREAFMALRLEVHFSKQEILHLYLNHAPYGGNVRGFQAASYKFFGKSPDQLTWSEAATLAVLPNAPGLIYPDQESTQLKRKRDYLLARLEQKRILKDETLHLAKLENTPNRFIDFNFEAPHLTRWLNKKYPDKDVIPTTIDRQLQKRLQQQTRQHLSGLRHLGITNGAVLLVETQTQEVKAYIGSGDWHDAYADGQVDGVMAARSSGSILKPFLYALSIDEGLIIPKTQIHDVPTYFDGFSPHNASEKFDGIVTAKDALIRSLNVPAARLLNAYGVADFHQFLKMAGISTLFRNADDYGLPLILGGAEVSPWDMAKLYSGLGNGGVFRDLKVTKTDAFLNSWESNLISEGASHLTLEMIRDLQRPDEEQNWRFFSSSRPLAWKTGTSYGHKDAWAVGVSPQWTIVVWIGNFDGQTNKNLSGSHSAAPLLFNIFNGLPSRGKNQWFGIDEINLQNIAVCTKSGFMAGEACPERSSAMAPAYMKPLKICPFHLIKEVDASEKSWVCSLCWNEGHHSKSYLKYPPDVQHFLAKRGKIIARIPPHNPECPQFVSDQTVQIIYPNDYAQIIVPRGFDGQYQKVLCKVANQKRDQDLYWYLDQEYLGTTNGTNELPVVFNPGNHNLEVIDENGGSDRVRFTVGKKEDSRKAR